MARRLLALVACGVLGGCAAPAGVFRLDQAQDGVVWPPSPETPRYRYVGELTGEQNFPAASEGWRDSGTRALKWLVGLGSSKREHTVLQRPQGGAVDAEGRVYVSDVSRQAVYVFDVPAGQLHVWEMALPGQRFAAPIGVAVGRDGELLVSDAEIKQVVRLGKQGQPLGGFGAGVLERPTGIARDAQRGLIYVADTKAHNIKVFDDSGVLVRTMGQRGEQLGEYNSPTYLAYADDKLYVSDTLNARVQVLPLPDGAVRSFGERGLFVGDMPRPKGVAVGKNGIVYVVETYYDYLLVFGANNEFLLPIGGTGSGIGQFYLPAGVWSDTRGLIYVADTFNGRVVVLQFLGGLNDTGG